ncbi:hypothetical protein HNQ38_000611 [Desulfovibrio intestinalis]|uniref:Uncharacterized protein n=1 Tax=Desulfovibrio intestinalis TaxID=58621 RepID=A0A7W8FG75_9BACT|nr:hypothetical protein [Desulfovibrio intestinalis]
MVAVVINIQLMTCLFLMNLMIGKIFKFFYILFQSDREKFEEKIKCCSGVSLKRQL